jgi:hypothetical protein
MSAIGYCTLVIVRPCRLARCNLASRWGACVSPVVGLLVEQSAIGIPQFASVALQWGARVSPVARLYSQQSALHHPHTLCNSLPMRKQPAPLEGVWSVAQVACWPPMEWHHLAGVRVSSVVIPLLLCLCRCRFCLCYFVEQITNLFQCIRCLCITRHRTL